MRVKWLRVFGASLLVFLVGIIAGPLTVFASTAWSVTSGPDVSIGGAAYGSTSSGPAYYTLSGAPSGVFDFKIPDGNGSEFIITLYDASSNQVGTVTDYNTSGGYSVNSVSVSSAPVYMKIQAVTYQFSPSNLPPSASSINAANGVPAPSVPTGLTGSAGNGQVILSWSGSSSDVSYNVYRNGVQVASGLSSTTYTSTGLTNGTSYSFTVTGVNSAGVESSQSSAVSVIPVKPVSAASVPSGLSANPADGQVSLTWVTSTGASSYNVYQDGKEIITGVTSPAYVATGLTDGTQYTFAVSAVDVNGIESALSQAVTATPTVKKNPVTSVNVQPSKTEAFASWNGNDSPFSVSWTDAAGNPVGSAPSVTGNSYTITGLSASSDYVVTVTDAGGASAKSAFNSGDVISPKMPDASGIFQKFVNLFGTAAKYALDIIGAAVGLGILVIVAIYVWRLLKKWLRKVG